MSTDTRLTRLLLSSAIKRCRRRSGQTSCPVRYRTMHAQERTQPRIDLDHQVINVVPFRPRRLQASHTPGILTSDHVADQERELASAEPEVAEMESRFPLYKSEPHFKLEDRPRTPPLPDLKGPLSKELLQLETDVPRLLKTLNQKQKLEMSETETEHLPELTEEELITFYHALESWSAGAAEESKEAVKAIAQGQGERRKGIQAPGMDREVDLMLVPQTRKKLGKQARREVLNGLLERLSVLQRDSIEPVQGETLARTERLVETELQEASNISASSSPSIPVEQRALQLIDRLSPKLSAVPGESTEQLPTGLLRQVEWDALVDTFAAKKDFETAAVVLDNMKNHGVPVGEERIEDLMRSYARTGDAVGLGAFLQQREKATGIETSKRHLEFMIEAHLARGDKASALQTLHHFEEQGKTLPQRAYTRVISSYTAGTTRSTISQTPQRDKAIAWDLFAHMRLVAHPIPSRSTYNAMILSCADPHDPQPERALDLLIGMEQESKLVPDGDTFDAAILACSRVKKFYLEGFKLLRRMLGLHQSAMLARNFIDRAEGASADSLHLGTTGYEPTLTTFNALLEGCKRRGDLSRTRWLLGEVIRLVRSGAGRGVDEEMVVNVLHCYAAFRPVFRNDLIKQVAVSSAQDSDEASSDASAELRDKATVPNESSTSDDVAPRSMTLMDVGSPEFSPPTGPQSAYEALQEAERLFQLILHDQGDGSSPFGWFKVGPRTVNAYLSVRFAHDGLASAIQSWQEVWSEPVLRELKVEKNGWSYVQLLERCAVAGKGPERQAVASVLPSIWQEYIAWADKIEAHVRAKSPHEAWVTKQTLGLGARQVERAWISCIRSLALLDKNRDALGVLERFKVRFPASDIVNEGTTTGGNLAPKPRIRLSSASNELEDQVPPHILFHDINILHLRLVQEGDLKGVGMVKWACVSYEKALETRRRRRLHDDRDKNKRSSGSGKTPKA